MYIFEGMLAMALEDNNLKEFPSLAHKKVCENLLLCNSRITSRALLSSNAKILLELPEEKIKEITVEDAFKLGVMVDY